MREDIFTFIKAMGVKVNEKVKGPNATNEFILSWILMKETEYNDFIHLSQKYNLGKLFYVASGSDTLPKDVLGIEKVVHLSIENYFSEELKQKIGHGNGCTYFSGLGEGIKVIGKAIEPPFADDSFDSTFCNLDFLMSRKHLEKYVRITKKNGLVILKMHETYDLPEEAILYGKLNPLGRYKTYFVFGVRKE